MSTPPAGRAGRTDHRRLSPLTPLVRSFVFVVAIVSTSWREVTRGELGPFAWMLVGLAVAGAVYGAASWFRTRYWIEADELRVDTGVLSRQSRRIRVDRLQAVDVVQPLVARLFGLAELRMDVAGGGAREGSLAFLPLREAHELRDLLLARRDTVRDGPPAEPAEAPVSAAALPERVLARVDLGMLLVGMLLSPETLVLLGGGLVVAGVLAVVGDWASASAVLPAVGGIALVQARRLANDYRFSVVETAAGLQVRRGLLELNAQTIALPRVQGVVLTEPVLWRRFGWARLDVSVAGFAAHDTEDRPSASTLLPIGDRARALALARHVLRGVDPEVVGLSGPPGQARWVAPVRRRFLAAGAGEDAVVSREGWLVRRTHVVPHARVQSLRLSQGPWQRRLGLADLHVDSPPGAVRLRARHRTAEEARLLLEREAVRAAAARQAAERPAR